MSYYGKVLQERTRTQVVVLQLSNLASTAKGLILQP